MHHDMEQICVRGTPFLECVLCTKNSSMPRCCFVSPHNSLFSLVLIFPSCSWSVVPCGTRSASAEEMRMRSSEAAKVLGFPNRARARKTCAKPPPCLAHSVRNVSELVPARHMSHDLCICAHQLRHNAIDLCQPRGALCTRNRARAHDLGNKKLCDRFAQMNLVLQVQLQRSFCSTHINPWKQGILLGLAWEN